MSVLGYFKLEISQQEPTLGKRKKPKNILRNTIILYFGVFLGVLGKYIFALYIPDQKFDFSLLDPFWLVIALIIAAVIFPQVYKGAKLKVETIDAMQFFIAIQNGFFWQSILEIVGKSISG